SDDDAEVAITLNDDIDVDSVTAGDSTLDTTGLTVDDGTTKTVYGPNGVDINGGDITLTDKGLDNGGQTITGVSDGAINSGSDEAINGSQLQTDNDSLAGDVLGGDAVYDGNTNSWDMGSDIGGTGQSTIDDAIESANNAATAGWDLTAEGNNSTNVGPGDSVDLNNSDGNIDISKTGTDNDVTFDLADELNVATSVTVGDSVLDAAGLTVDDGTNSTTVGAGVINVAGSGNTIVVDGDAGTIGGLTNTT